MKKLDLQPNTPEWLEARANYRTASEAPIVLGISPFVTREKFKLIKAGIAKQFYSRAMQRGHEQEAQIREWANRQFSRNFREEVWVREGYLASLDGIDDGVVLEIKTSTRTFNEINDGKIPPYYLAQIQQQLYCCGADRAHLVAYCPSTQRYAASAPIYPDEAAMTKIAQAWAEFDAMPMPDGPIDASDNVTLLRDFEQYAAIKREIERMEAAAEEIRARILEFKAPDRPVVCNGYQIVVKAGASRVDYKKAATDAKLDLTAYKTQGEPTYSLKLAPAPFEVDPDE